MKRGDCLFNRVMGRGEKGIKNSECLCKFNAHNESVPCEYSEEDFQCEFYKDSKIWEIRKKRKE